MLATVKGDVHDIGKNLVDIILTNNGYKVVNLGIKQPIDDILRSWEETKAGAIGLSGLLDKSTLVMRDNLELMNERDITVPVILGGAALNVAGAPAATAGGGARAADTVGDTAIVDKGDSVSNVERLREIDLTAP